jgi:membrane dipeptidase
VVDHVVHMLAQAGEDHVGLGSDFDGIASVPTGLEDSSGLPTLADALAARGVSNRVIEKVFAGNWLRLLGES